MPDALSFRRPSDSLHIGQSQIEVAKAAIDSWQAYCCLFCWREAKAYDQIRQALPEGALFLGVKIANYLINYSYSSSVRLH